ncbi:hypothetical protein AXF14_12055 [Actinomyces radicidentis]|uniref:DUF1648 domain-containing protein n=1 Tax=Actinomyces radicidentis TaxID=111015 RepID=A0A0X8JG08_ACTRD|nr:DUF5808 domain-containing protein [Actinomyces radicidentis]AMD88179.1 hypothetical protein AXF14_12055 [Actinomyces radicidentis]
MLGYALSMVGTMALMGLLLALTPAMSRDTVPLGVSVPADRVKAPVVLAALHHWRLTCLAVTVVLSAILLASSTAGVLKTHAGLPVSLIIGQIAVLLMVWARLRRPIVDAKRADDWYESRPVRLVATVTTEAGPTPMGHRHLLWYVAGVAALLLAGAFTIARYSALPDPYPFHWDASGRVDGWTRLSRWAVLEPTIVGLLTLAVCLGCSVATGRRLVSRVPIDGDRHRSEELAAGRARIIAHGVGAIGLATAIVFSGITILPTLGSGGIGQALVLVPTVLMGVVLVLMVSALIRLAHRHPRTCDGDADSPDEDAHWPWGLVYVNPADPALMVPKRNGAGLTINMGHPVGRVLGVILLALLAVMFVVGLLPIS